MTIEEIKNQPLHMSDFCGVAVPEFHPLKSFMGFITALRGDMDLNQGVEEYFRGLAAQGKDTALVTTAKKSHMAHFKHIDLQGIFGDICTSEGFGDKREQYLVTLEKHKQHAWSGVAYEDSAEGVDAVKSIFGLKLVLVDNPTIKASKRQELATYADLSVKSFTELLNR